MQPARFRQADISLVKIDNAKSMSPGVSSGRSAGSFPEQRLVIEPKRRGIITLLPKEDGSLLDLHNWRPVTRLNVDSKIATKAIANSNFVK